MFIEREIRWDGMGWEKGSRLEVGKGERSSDSAELR